MRFTGLIVCATIALCLAVWLVVTGWNQPRPSLENSVGRLHRTRAPGLDDASDTASSASPLDRLGRHAASIPILDRSARWNEALRLIGRPTHTHLGLLIVASLGGMIVPTVLMSLAHVSGVVSLGVFVPAGLVLAAAIGAPLAVHADAIARSDVRRIDVRHQLSAYLDMVTMLLAGNTGYEGALEQAAGAGDGLLFVELRKKMREVGTTGHSLIGALDRVGHEFGVAELVQVAAAASLSASEGAPVARTLAAKCSTLRSTLAAEQEARARVRNDKITPPLVGMALLFMALIIYPALNLG